jgi:flagellar motor protein MotB
MSRFINFCRLVADKGVCLTLVIGLILFGFGCRSFSNKSPSAFQPVPAQPVPAQPASTPTDLVRPEPTPRNPTQPPQPVSVLPSSSQPVLAQSLPIPTTSYRPPTFLEVENQSRLSSEQPMLSSGKTMVFRPQSSSSLVLSEKPIPESMTANSSLPSAAVPPNISSNIPSSVSANTDVDVLNRRISELEKALAERATPTDQEKQPTTVSRPIVSSGPVSRWVPTIRYSGVMVSSDSERIRIEIPDQVLFQSGTWRLNPDAEELLRKIAGEIRANEPESLLEIEGHTDGVMNTDPANTTQKHDLSSAKTMVIMEYFVGSLRWNATRIKTSSFGSSRPVAENDTAEGRSRNNRIEIVVLPQKR